MSSTQPDTKAYHLLLMAFPAWICLLLLRLNTPLYIGDDSYMTFKVARNLLEGHGFLYNPGEYVLGTTTALWAAILAVLTWISGTDPVEVFRPIGLLLDLGNCLLIAYLSSASGMYLLRGAMSAILFSLSWHMTFASLVGMETNLFIFLMLCCLLLQLSDRRLLSGILASLVFVTRPEGALLLISLGLCRLVRDRRIPWPEIIGGSILTIGYVCWLQVYFGSPVPHAGIAKSIGYHRTSLQALQSLTDHLVMLTITPFFDSPAPTREAIAASLWVIWLIGAWHGAKVSIGHAIAAVFTLLVQVLYSVMNPHVFEWYVVPLEVSYVVSIVWGVSTILERCRQILWRDFYPQATTAIALMTIGIALARYEFPQLSLAIEAKPGGYRNWPSLVRSNNPFLLAVLSPRLREEIYVGLAKSLNRESTSESVIIAPEYGAFGYYSNARMLSSIGHNSKEMLRYLPAPKEQLTPGINNAITIEMVEAFKPEYVLSLEVFIRNSLLKSASFKASYELVQKVPSNVFGSDGIYLFRRNNLLADDALSPTDTADDMNLDTK